jgi:phage-related protein
LITLDLELASSEPDVTLVDVPGRAGSIVLDNKRDKAVTQTFNLFCKLPHPKGTEMMRQVMEWLRTDVKVHDFTLSSEPDYVRHGAILTAIPATVKSDGVYGTAVFNFEPRRYLKESLVEQQITSGAALNNPGSVVAKPRITITGSGDMTLVVNGTKYGIKGMDQGIIIDSDSQSIIAADQTTSEFSKFQAGSFPELKKGNNTITWDSGFTAKIIPRCAVKL